MKNIFRLILIGLWIGFFAVTYVLYSYGNYVRFDFSVYYRAAQSLIDGEPLYNGAVGMVYLYPPLLAQVLAPLVAAFPFETVAALWFIFNGLLLIATCTLLSRQFEKPPFWLWLMPVFFPPFWEALYIGQVTIVILALLIGAWLAIRQDKEVIGGILIALSIWIKIFPALMVIYFLINRRWRVMLGVGIGIVGFGLLQVLISGPQVMWDYQEVITELFVAGQDGNNFKNHSVLGFSSRLFLETYKSHELLLSEALFSITRWALTVIMLGITAFVIRQQDEHDQQHFDLGYALILITSVLLSSTVWMSGLVFLYFVYFIALKHGHNTSGVKVTVLISYMLVVVFHFVDLGLNRDGLPALLLSLGFYAQMLMWSIISFMAFRTQRHITFFRQPLAEETA